MTSRSVQKAFNNDDITWNAIESQACQRDTDEKLCSYGVNNSASIPLQCLENYNPTGVRSRYEAWQNNSWEPDLDHSPPRERRQPNQVSNSRRRSRSRSAAQGPMESLENGCTYCHKAGHSRDTCWRRLGWCLLCGSQDHRLAGCPQMGVARRRNNRRNSQAAGQRADSAERRVSRNGDQAEN